MRCGQAAPSAVSGVKRGDVIVVEGVLITALFVALRDRRRTLAVLNDERNSLEDRVLQRTLELLMANTKLEQLATTDPLTGIANRRKMTDTIGAELPLAKASHAELQLGDIAELHDNAAGTAALAAAFLGARFGLHDAVGVGLAAAGVWLGQRA